ncbi:MAG: hypothetical protein RI909_980 [Bacteroidota bacterium]
MKILIFFIGVVVAFPSYSQYQAEEFQAAMIQTKFGAMIIYNGKKNSFTLRIISKSIEPTEQENFLLVDKNLVQSSIIPFQEKFDFKAMPEQLQRQLLTGYKEYEKEYVQEQLKIQLEESEQFLNLEGKIFKYWTFSMPKDNDSVSKQLYLFTICFDQILMLNGPVVKDQPEAELKNILIGMAKTLELFPDKTQDVRKLYFDFNN